MELFHPILFISPFSYVAIAILHKLWALNSLGKFFSQVMGS